MAKGNIQPGGNRRDGQKNLNHDHRPDFIRDHTSKKQYENHDEQTNDENFKAGKPKSDSEEMDFRNKLDNLEDENNNQ